MPIWTLDAAQLTAMRSPKRMLRWCVEIAVADGGGRTRLLGGQGVKRCERHDALGLHSEFPINRDQSVSLQRADGKVLSVEDRLPSVLTTKPPRSTTRHPVAEQSHLHFGETLMLLERELLGDVALVHGRQQQGQRLRPNTVRSDELMRGMDVDVVGNDTQECRRIDHVASHWLTLRISDTGFG